MHTISMHPVHSPKRNSPISQRAHPAARLLDSRLHSDLATTRPPTKRTRPASYTPKRSGARRTQIPIPRLLPQKSKDGATALDTAPALQTSRDASSSASRTTRPHVHGPSQASSSSLPTHACCPMAPPTTPTRPHASSAHSASSPPARYAPLLLPTPPAHKDGDSSLPTRTRAAPPSPALQPAHTRTHAQAVRVIRNPQLTRYNLPHNPHRLVPRVDQLALVRLDGLAGDLVRPAGVVSRGGRG
jgi:hypothetical protein